MTEFVKTCPKCGSTNPEYENLCRQCGHFIGMELARPLPPAEVAAPVPEAPVAGALRLSVPGTTLGFGVNPGDVLGQAHADSDAQIQLPASVTDVAYVHRRHCRFLQEGGQWLVEAIDQGPLGRDFTNPSWVNGVPLRPGERRPLGNGDDLRLSGTTLLVSLG